MAKKTLKLKNPVVGVIMGSDSDLEAMMGAVNMLNQVEIPHEVRIISAHRTPDAMTNYAKSARGRGLKVIIAAAGGSAHLQGMTAANTILPVVGVPISSRHWSGQDSLLSVVEMPNGVPVATVGINKSENAALLAAQILATSNEEIALKLENLREKRAKKVSIADKQISLQGVQAYIDKLKKS